MFSLGLQLIRISKNIQYKTLFRQKIAFVDFQNEELGKKAMEFLKGYRFPGSLKGISNYFFMFNNL